MKRKQINKTKQTKSSQILRKKQNSLCEDEKIIQFTGWTCDNDEGEISEQIHGNQLWNQYK